MRGAVWCSALLLLAGCADGSSGQQDPDAFKGLAATDTTGVIRGIVVNENIVPVEGARVVASPGDLQTATDASGAFGFRDLEPGVYFLTVSAPYHITVQSSVEVVAGVDRPPVHNIRVQTLPKPVPAIQELTYRFFMDASAMTPVTGFVAGGFTGQGSFGARLDIADNASWVQSELAWEPEQALATDVRMYSSLHAETRLANTVVRGPSPLMQAFTDSNVTAAAQQIAYTLFIDYGTIPVGATVGQEVHLFLHVFQQFVPDEGWRFSRDGAHPVPPAP